MWSHKRSGDRREVHLHRNMNKRAHVYVEYETGGPGSFTFKIRTEGFTEMWS